MSLHERLNALSTPIRTRILLLLREHELSVGEVAQITQLPQPTMSRHLKQLLEVGWVTRRRNGSQHFFQLHPALNPLHAKLFNLVVEELKDRWPEDRARLTLILQARLGSDQGFFSEIAERWSEVRSGLYGDHFITPSLLSLLGQSLTVADLGCGNGELLVQLAPVAHKVIGIDREPAMLDIAHSCVRRFKNIELRQGTLESPPLNRGEVDLILLSLVLHLVHKPEVVFTAITPALTDAGKILIVDCIRHQREEYHRSMGHIHLGFSEDDVRGLLPDELQLQSYHRLPVTPNVSGPQLFCATIIKRN